MTSLHIEIVIHDIKTRTGSYSGIFPDDKIKIEVDKFWVQVGRE